MPVQLIGPDGREYDLDESQGSLEDALSRGFRVATGEKSLAESVKAGVSDAYDAADAFTSGALEGASMGFIKPNPEAEGLLGRKAKDELAAGAGEFAGFMLSPLTKVAAPLRALPGAATVGARLAGAALEGAGIGALAGAGEAVGDASLPGAPELNAETLLYSSGLGALLGGAGGGLGEVLVEGASAVLPKAVKLLSGARGTLDDFANDAALGATRAQQSVINRMSEQELASAAKAIRERGHLDLTPQRMFDSLKGEIGGLEASEKSLLERMAAETPEGLPTRPGFDVTDVSTLAEDGARMGNVGRRSVINQERLLAEKGLPGSPGYEVVEGSRFPDVTPHPLQGELDSAREALGGLRVAERLAKSGANRAGGIGLKDLLVGQAFSSFHPVAITSAIGSKLVREYGPGLVAKAADAIAKSPSLMAIANGFAKRAAGVEMGAFAPMFQQAAAKGPQAVLATHMLLAQVQPEYQQLAAGFRDADGPSLARGASVAQVGANLAEADSSLERQVARIFKGEKSHSTSAAGQDFGAKRLRRDGHDVRAEQIQQLAADPSQLVERIAANTGALSNVTPALAAAMAQTAQRAVTYLAQNSQKPLKAGPLAAEWTPPQAEKDSFARKYAAIVDPGIILDHAAAGTMTPDEWEAVRVVYPLLAQSISNKALKRLAENPAVPYRARLMVGMLAGVSADGSSSGAAIARNQAAIHSAPQKQDEQPQQPLKAAGRMATPSQRREMEAT